MEPPESNPNGPKLLTEAFWRAIEKNLGAMVLDLNLEGIQMSRSELREYLASLWSSPSYSANRPSKDTFKANPYKPDQLAKAFLKITEKKLSRLTRDINQELNGTGMAISEDNLREYFIHVWGEIVNPPPASDPPPEPREIPREEFDQALLRAFENSIPQVMEDLRKAGIISTEKQLRDFFARSCRPFSEAEPPIQQFVMAQGMTMSREEFGRAFLKALENSIPQVIKALKNACIGSHEKLLQDFFAQVCLFPPAPGPVPDLPPVPTIPPIDPELFKIHSNGGTWSNSEVLLSFGQDDHWTCGDSYEGVLILGAPGSGKTSGSGAILAQTFLSAGYGGLVLCAKKGEAQRWQKLCARNGRGEDCITVTRDGPYRLNALDYESQRPGGDFGLSDNLISFFRTLLEIASKDTGSKIGDNFWTSNTDRLMKWLFETFFMAGEPLTFDGLADFITAAPQGPLKDPENGWRNIPGFGDILARAALAKTEEDVRIYSRVLNYWTQTFPAIPPETRVGIVLGFEAMASALSGRGIHGLISSDTTITPEAILSGAIIILDLPIKECGKGGHLVQSAWKYLFQNAVERRSDVGDARRPVFLWEDEGHTFFSRYDIEFQATARESRAAHVLISQNLHNFYQLGHNPHAVQGVFSLMNTQIFHANNDLETNKWASDRIGQEQKTNFSTQSNHDPNNPNSSTNIGQDWEPSIRPEEFSRLKKGGDGTCEAIILWMSHQFKSNNNKPFSKLVFTQEQI